MRGFLKRWWPAVLYCVVVVAVCLVLVRHCLEEVVR